MTLLPSTIDAPRRGRALPTALTVLGVAAATAAALLVPGSDAAAEPAAVTEQPEYPIPDLPPLGENERYQWRYFGTDGTDSKDAARYGKALYKWLGGHSDIELPDRPPVQLFDNEIWVENTETGEGQPTGESLPVYGLSWMDYDGGMTGSLYFTGTDRDATDGLDLQVWPRGSYRDGDGETFEYLADCTDHEEFTDLLMFVDYTCTYSTAPDGGKILSVETVRTEAGTDDVYGKSHTAVWFRNDGTAVKVEDAVPGPVHADFPLDPELEPYLSTGELTELLLTMPDATVGA